MTWRPAEKHEWAPGKIKAKHQLSMSHILDEGLQTPTPQFMRHGILSTILYRLFYFKEVEQHAGISTA